MRSNFSSRVWGIELKRCEDGGAVLPWNRAQTGFGTEGLDPLGGWRAEKKASEKRGGD